MPRLLQVDQANDKIRLQMVSSGKSTTVEGSHLLVATGRVPNSDTLNLPRGGNSNRPTWIHQGERSTWRRQSKASYALGDIKGGPAFTHISYDDFRILRTNLIEGKSASTKGRQVPYCVFIDPQLGRVGLTESEAREQRRKVYVWENCR